MISMQNAAKGVLLAIPAVVDVLLFILIIFFLYAWLGAVRSPIRPESAVAKHSMLPGATQYSWNWAGAGGREAARTDGRGSAEAHVRRGAVHQLSLPGALSRYERGHGPLRQVL